MIDLVDISSKLEGRIRHGSTHAAGIVISDKPLIETTPLYQRTGDILTQYDMDSIAKLGLIKFDVLGLRTLTLIHEACNLIIEKRWIPEDIPLDDKAVYMYLSDAENMIGIFQYEGWGFRRFIRRLKPRNFNDLIALGALYRPGPLNSGMADDYVARKHGDIYENEFPGITDNTYGILLYQEQIMQVVHQFAGFTMSEADTLRKAIGKKDSDLMEKILEKFKSNMYRNKYSEQVTNDLINKIVTFARYGWNKSHSVAYALLSYQTAWLRVNYPLEFLTALLNSEITDNKRLETILEEVEGAPIEKAHVNVSDERYVLKDGAIYAGLLAVKGIGQKACDEILEERTRRGLFADEKNFRERIPAKAVNSTAFTALLKEEAFRCN